MLQLIGLHECHASPCMVLPPLLEDLQLTCSVVGVVAARVSTGGLGGAVIEKEDEEWEELETLRFYCNNIFNSDPILSYVGPRELQLIAVMYLFYI